MTDDLFKSFTYAIDLVCGKFPFCMSLDEDKLKKVFLHNAQAHHHCPIFLLEAITELSSELCKTKTGHEAAIKILGRRNCVVGQNHEHLSCLDGLAKLLIAFK